MSVDTLALPLFPFSPKVATTSRVFHFPIPPFLCSASPCFAIYRGEPLIAGEERAALIKRIQFGGDEVVKAKDGAGSATLSMAWAAAKFTDALLRAMGGETGVIIPTFVESPLFADKGCDFFASKVELSKEGVGKIHGLGDIADWEKELLDVCLKDLAGNIKKVTSLLSPKFY